jgi:hypothetical protein
LGEEKRGKRFTTEDPEVAEEERRKRVAAGRCGGGCAVDRVTRIDRESGAGAPHSIEEMVDCSVE